MPRRLPRSLPPPDTDAMIAAADRPRDRLIVLVLLVCGLRNSELTRLQVADLDLDAGTLFVTGKGDKDRSVPAPSWLCDELRAYLAGRVVGWVFPSRNKGGRLSARSVQRLMVSLAKKAGLPDAGKPRRVNPHRMRHSCATRLLRSGADIMEVKEILGHSSISVTQNYLSADGARLKAAAERAFAPPPGRKAG